MKRTYAIYKGDEFLFMGTREECAKYLKVKVETISFYSTPSHYKRGKSNNRVVVIKVDD